MRVKYELQMWFNHLLKCIPGKIGCFLRNLVMPYNIGENSYIWDGVHIDAPSKLTIGNNTSINRGGVINAAGDVSIGNDVLIGPGVFIYSQNHTFREATRPISSQGYNRAAVIIHDGVWLGAGCIILPGVEIGEHSIIGAGSVISESIPPFSIATSNREITIKVRHRD